jgi:hypothetical protein
VGDEFQYLVLRVVPHVERGERLNAGVILFARTRRFLEARIGLDEAALRALAPDADAAAIRTHLEALARVAAGDPAGGPLAALEPSERFHWLAAPSSTVIQPSEVHTGLCGQPAETLEKLFAELVARPAAGV